MILRNYTENFVGSLIESVSGGFSMGVFSLSIVLALITGFSIKRGNICAVAAVHQWVNHRNAFHMRSLFTGMCCAGLVLAVMAWGFQGSTGIFYEYEVTSITVLAGALFGVGAWLNRACILGTISFVSTGDLNYLGTLLGLFIGALLGQYGYNPMLTSNIPVLQTPTALAAGIVCLYGVVLLLNVMRHLRSKRVPQNLNTVHQVSYNLLPMIIVVGTCSAILHALNGEWTYPATFIRIAEGLATDAKQPLGSSAIYSIATFAGGLLAAKIRSEIKIQALRISLIARRLIGGTAMGIAICMIPGGNESMMFSGAPSLALHAVVAYVSMTLTLYIVTYASQYRAAM